MGELNERMPYVTAFPRALGTGMIVRSSRPIGDDRHAEMSSFIDDYERTLSRFRDDSTVVAMGRAEHGGTFDFPAWTIALFDLYDALCDATDGAIDPCVGEDLIRLGYGADYSFTVAPDAGGRLGTIHGRPTWRGDIERRGTATTGATGTDHVTSTAGTTLVTHRPVHLDFGACGKGYLVDLLAARFLAQLNMEFVIDAGGDLLVRSSRPITIALEDPADTSRAIGTASVSSGAFCASAPSRRRWESHRGNGDNQGTNTIVHHLLNAIDGLPVRNVAATWTSVVSTGVGHPTALADGLATALFVADPNRLAACFPRTFDCAILDTDRTLAASHNFPATFFTR